MQPAPRKHTPQGGGGVGFGCGFILVGAIAYLSIVPLDRHGYLTVLVIALVGGWLAAKFGDPFFYWISRWWWWR